MKNILNNIEFHYTYLIMLVGLVLTGHFVNVFIFTSLILIHEMGHAFASLLFKYKVEKIIIYPYGGITKVNKLVNTRIWKDILVAISGVLFQTIYFFIIYIFTKNGLVREYVYNLFLTYHKSMMIFNLLPIIPLDGSKIINLILSKYLNFNMANNMTVIISLIVIVILLFSDIYENNYSIVMTLGVLFQNIYKFYKEISFVYNKFLLERYLYNFNYSKVKVIKDRNKMYKNCHHLFIKNGKMMDEKRYLNNIFGKKA